MPQQSSKDTSRQVNPVSLENLGADGELNLPLRRSLSFLRRGTALALDTSIQTTATAVLLGGGELQQAWCEKYRPESHHWENEGKSEPGKFKRSMGPSKLLLVGFP